MIVGVFGLCGTGKSLLLASEAVKVIQGKKTFLTHSKYSRVYTNFPIQGAYKLEWDMLGEVDFTDSLLIVDEITQFADSRDYKNFTEQQRFFFSQHRKFKCDFLFASQIYDDVEKRIRENTHYLYHIDDFIFNFSIVRRIVHDFNVSNGSICSGFYYAPPITNRFFYRPKRYSLVDSFSFVTKKTVNIKENSAPLW